MIKYFISLLLSIYPLFALEIEIGTGVFASPTKGTVIYQSSIIAGSTGDVDNSIYPQPYIWTEIGLGLPYEPHIRFEYIRLVADGSSVMTFRTSNAIIREFAEDLGAEKFRIGSILVNNLFDAYLYYDILKESKYYPTVAIGGGVKTFSYTYDIALRLQNNDLDDGGGATIPLLYFKADKHLDSYPISFEFDAKYYAFSESDIYDLRGKVELMFEVNKNTKIGVELGYRDIYFNIIGEDIRHVGGNMHYNGFFFGLKTSFR